MAATTEPLLQECQMSMKTILLEKEYARVVAESTRLLDAERDRARRMEYLLLQFENDATRSQLENANTRLHECTRAEAETSQQLHYACQEINRLEQSVVASSHEVESLKAEMSTLNESSTNQRNLVSEKVQLSRELASLTSEYENLKAQNASQQASSAGKFEMERQLNSLEVELENEKNAHERTRVKVSQQADEIKTLATLIEDLQGKITKESRSKQQREKDDRQQQVDWQSQRSVLESRVETLKKQLRTSKDKLQEAKNQLQQRGSFSRGNDDESPEQRTRTVPLQRAGPGADYQEGVTIATPGAVRTQAKTTRQSALPGDKSVFSITPFLNRTGAPRDSPISSEADEDEVRDAISDTSRPFVKPQVVHDVGASPQPMIKPRPSTVATKTNAKSREGKLIKKATGNSDLKVPLRDADDSYESMVDLGQAKQKKRKLGAQRGDRALFDEEEEVPFESRKLGRKLGLGGGRASVLATSQAQSASLGDEKPPRTKSLALGGLGGFSPLKRDRKR